MTGPGSDASRRGSDSRAGDSGSTAGDSDASTDDSGASTEGSNASEVGSGAITVEGCRIAYRRAGTDGPPVVLLHGAGVDDSDLSWRHVVGALADDHRVYAPDWPGYGDSDDGVEHSTASYVGVLEGFLDAVGLESATLVGISMGGAAALGFALTHPARADRLALVDSYGLGDRVPGGPLWKTTAHLPGANALGWSALGTSRRATRMGLANVVADADALPAEFVDAFRARAAAPGAGRAFEAFQRNELGADGRARTNFAPDLERVSAPTLLVHGAEDPVFPAAWSKRAAERIPGAHLEILENCGHWPPRERPNAFEAVLREFLAATGP